MPERQIDLPEGVPPLTQYYVYLTGGCNLACQHCWISPSYQAHGGTGGHLDYDLFAQALEEGMPLGLQSIKLTGGEPLLHPDFVRIVNLIKENDLGLTIETNGTLMTAKLADHLKNHSTLRHISVSLDGACGETHDSFRGVKSSFEKAVQGINHLVEVGFHPQVIMSLHPGNVDEIIRLVRLAEELGVGSVKFNIIQPTGRGEVMTDRGQLLDIHQLIELGKWIDGDLQAHTSIRLFYSWPMAFYNLQRLLNSGLETCGLNNILGILSSGHLAMCGVGMHVQELVYGELGIDQIANIWTSHPLLTELRIKIPGQLEGICQECIFRDRCVGSCIASNYQFTHTLTSPFWFCQLASGLGLFPATRRQVIN